jgi:hypothetical protein
LKKGFRHAPDHTNFCLKTPDMRQACATYEHMMSAVSVPNNLPFPVLISLRDFVEEQARGRIGPLRDLLFAYAAYLEHPLREARRRDREEPLGLHREQLPLRPQDRGPVG